MQPNLRALYPLYAIVAILNAVSKCIANYSNGAAGIYPVRHVHSDMRSVEITCGRYILSEKISNDAETKMSNDVAKS